MGWGGKGENGYHACDDCKGSRASWSHAFRAWLCHDCLKNRTERELD